MKHLTLFFIGMPITFFSLAQTTIQWDNTIGGNGSDELSVIHQTANGGYLIGGSSNSNIGRDKHENSRGDYDYWIVKLNKTGKVKWQKTLGGADYDHLNCIQETTDGGCIAGGTSKSNVSGDKTENTIGDKGFEDIWVVKLDEAGNIQWQNTIGGNRQDYLNAIQQTADGGYILGASSYSNISGDKTENNMGTLKYDDYWVIKLDAAGNIQWQNTIGGNYDDALYSIQQTTDGGYILGGISDSDSSGDKTEDALCGDCFSPYDLWIVKLNAAGNIQWQNTIGGRDNELYPYVEQTNDGGYIVGCSSWSDRSGDKTENRISTDGSNDYWIIKLNATGDIQWQNTVGSINGDYFASVRQTADDGYIAGGFSYGPVSGDKTENSKGYFDYWIVKLNKQGKVQSDKTIGGSGSESLQFVTQTNDGGYVLGGTSSSDSSGDKTEDHFGRGPDYWIVKLAPVAPITQTGRATLPNTFITADKNVKNVSLKVFPNPVKDNLFIQSDKRSTIIIQNIYGQTLLTKNLDGTEKINISFFPAGFYFIREINSGNVIKILKQ